MTHCDLSFFTATKNGSNEAKIFFSNFGTDMFPGGGFTLKKELN